MFSFDDAVPQRTLLRRREQRRNLGSVVTGFLPAPGKPGSDAMDVGALPSRATLLELVPRELFGGNGREIR
jgi:hypothetical protein